MMAAHSSGHSACGVAPTQQAGARSSLRALVASTALVLVLCPPAFGGYQVFLPPAQSPVDIIHTTDLYYPAWDWDDVNDATSLYALHTGGYARMALFSMEQDSGDRGNGEAWRGIYANFDLDPMTPSPWAGDHATSRPQLPASIARPAVIADPAVFFDESQDYIYERLDGSPGWAFGAGASRPSPLPPRPPAMSPCATVIPAPFRAASAAHACPAAKASTSAAAHATEAAPEAAGSGRNPVDRDGTKRNETESFGKFRNQTERNGKFRKVSERNGKFRDGPEIRKSMCVNAFQVLSRKPRERKRQQAPGNREEDRHSVPGTRQ